MLVRNSDTFRLSEIVRRTFDAVEVNAILNHPSVFPYITLPGLTSIDVTPLLADPRNVALMADRGCILFLQQEPGIYEVHTNFIKVKHGERKGTDGAYTKDACLASYRWMFTHTDCMILLGRIPEFNRALKIFAPLLGWTTEYTRPKAWPYKDELVDLTFVSIPYDHWFRKTDDLAESGKQFHDKLETEFKRHEVQHKAHDDDAWHDKAVGALLEMILGGQVEKGIVLYNRWAQFAGYFPIKLVSRNPLLIDIGDALLQIENGDFKAVLCR